MVVSSEIIGSIMTTMIVVLVSIWTLRLGRLIVLKFLSKRWRRGPHWSVVPICFGLLLGMLWGVDWSSWVGCVLVGCFIAAWCCVIFCCWFGFFVFLFLRPFLILAKEKFRVSLVESLECVLCFFIVAIPFAWFGKLIRFY